MITRTYQHEQDIYTLVFDRDAIVRAALHAYVEGSLIYVDPLERLAVTASNEPFWKGDVQRGAFHNGNGCGDYEIVAWTDAGVVGLAWELGWGPIEQLGLSVDAVTGGPDDVRAAVPELPPELEDAFLLAVDMLDVGPRHGEKMAGVGFWLCGDRVGGSMFEDPTAAGGDRLAAWGALQDGRLPLLCDPETVADWAAEHARRGAAPIQALVDALTARALSGPTELTAAEVETLLPSPPQRARLLGAQRRLQMVGIAWPGLPALPAERRPTGRDPFLPPPTTVYRPYPHGDRFDRDTLVRAALHAYVEHILAKLDPLGRHPFPVCDEPKWTGDLQRGAFYNGVACGDYDVVAWTESGVIGLTYKVGFGPIEQLGLSASAVTGGPDDVRAALPDLPAEMEPALVMATGLLRAGPQGEKLSSLGFWLHGRQVAGSYFEAKATAPGLRRMRLWATLGVETLCVLPDPNDAAIAGNFALWTNGPILDIVDAVVDRAMAGPTELLADELETLLPSPPDAERLLAAQRMLQKVGITWPGSPEIPDAPRPTWAG